MKMFEVRTTYTVIKRKKLPFIRATANRKTAYEEYNEWMSPLANHRTAAVFLAMKLGWRAEWGFEIIKVSEEKYLFKPKVWEEVKR